MTDKPLSTRDKILQFAAKEVKKIGLAALTRDALAEAMGVGAGTINYHFTDMTGLRSALMDHAIKTENAHLLSEGLRLGLIRARRAPDALKEQAVKFIIN